MEQSSIWYFEDVNLFNLFCPHKLKEHRKNHSFIDFKRGDFVYFDQDQANKVYLIAEGKVKIAFYTEDGREIVKSVLGPGELFGELAILGSDKREEFAQAADNKTVLCPLDVETMHGLMREHKTFSFKVYKFIGLRIKKLERKVESLIAKDVRTRLVEFLLDFAEEKGRKAGTETLIKHSLTQKDIADLIGTSRQTVTTLLNEMKEQNLIYFDRKRILIRDLKQLSESFIES